MSAVKSGSSLKTLVLTPERIPNFLIPHRSPMLLFNHRSAKDRTRLLSDHDDASPELSPTKTPLSPAGLSPRLRHLLPRFNVRHRTADVEDCADADLATRAAMSLPHVQKVTTPYGFRAVLAASPCTRRRESLFHPKKPAPESTDPQAWTEPTPGPSPSPNPNPSTSPSPSHAMYLRPLKTLGQHVMKELKRPARCPGPRRTKTR